MLDQKQRGAILALHEQKHSIHAIARALKVSRGAVREVLRTGSQEVPLIIREQAGEPWREDILEQYMLCKGNLIRVHEEITKKGARLSYQALTAFCRRHGIGFEPKLPAGRYNFEPGQEMQHDTSPHKANVGGVLQRTQTASLVMCYSRMFFFQSNPTFNRFDCKIFLTEALEYFKGAAKSCMIDNTHVVVLRGTGAKMEPVPEMEAFAERYGFTFKAHEVGDANRSARVEGPFNFIENNFFAGREFKDFKHLNEEARVWCDKKNASFSNKLHSSRKELFVAEMPCLTPLPIWVPEVYRLHHRIVDVEGYVQVNGNRYSAPWKLIGRRMDVRETKDRIEIFDGPRIVALHERKVESSNVTVTIKEHRPPRGHGRRAIGLAPEEEALLKIEPGISNYLAELKKHTNFCVVALRRLLRLLREYPREPFLAAVQCAEKYGLFDLERLERMVLKRIAADYFILPINQDKADDDDDE